MPDRRQVLRALLLAGTGIALPAGCGVPSGGPPFVDGTGPTYDPIGGQQGKPPDPSGADTPTALVELFLAAVSGPLENPEQRATARDRARASCRERVQAQVRALLLERTQNRVRYGGRRRPARRA